MSSSGSTATGIRFFSSTASETDGYAEIETDARPEIQTVRLYEETIMHVRESHAGTFPPQFPPDFPFMIRAVASTVQAPTRVDETYGNSLVYVDENTQNAQGHSLNVFVKRIEGSTSGRVKTFFFAGVEDDESD